MQIRFELFCCLGLHDCIFEVTEREICFCSVSSLDRRHTREVGDVIRTQGLRDGVAGDSAAADGHLSLTALQL
ncbi:hypothetical protein TB1_027702 [Malus domestica]